MQIPQCNSFFNTKLSSEDFHFALKFEMMEPIFESCDRKSKPPLPV